MGLLLTSFIPNLLLDPLGGLVFSTVTICLLTYTISRISWELEIRNNDSLAPKTPPTIPYTIPFLGNLLAIVWNPQKFIHEGTWAFKTPNPFGFRVFNSKIFFLQGAQNLNAFWRKDMQMGGMKAQVLCLKYLFGMPTRALQMYIADDSGFQEKPSPHSMITPDDRVDYQTHVSLLQFTSGKHFAGFYKRWFTSFAARLGSLKNLNDWVEHPDLCAFFEGDFALAVVEATCGTILERENPDFAQDLATYIRYTPTLSKGLPRCFAPSAYAIRDKLLGNVKSWHRIARANFRPECVDEDGDADPFWGSEFIRARQRMFQSFKGFDEDAAAASDLGFIWALTANIVPTIMWVVLEIHKDQSLRSKIRTELKENNLLGDIQVDDIKTILTLPRLQSVYAEALRLYDQVLLPRETTEEVQVNGWKFPKKSTIVICSYEAQSDAQAWNTGMHNERPVDSFWAERFLIYPDDPDSGPIVRNAILPSARLSESQLSDLKRNSNGGPIFSEKTTAGYYIPYGGGARICPGRHFAKRSIMTAAVMMTAMVDMEISASKEELRIDERGFGLGGQRPVGKVPYRIRRWQERLC